MLKYHWAAVQLSQLDFQVDLTAADVPHSWIPRDGNDIVGQID